MVHLIKAARGNINTQHGEQIGRGFPHVGIDIGWGGGLELYAPAAGWLSWSWAGSYGNLGRINHADGSYSRIAHADSYSGVNGRHVKQGEHIGTMGKSGGPWGTSGWFVHCHQEYWVDGVAVDPTDYMGSSTAGEDITPITPIILEEDEDMASGIYTRIDKGQSAGSIYYQEGPGSPLYALVGEEWAAAAANGNRYTNLDAQLVQALQRRVGVIKREPKYGRIVRDAAGQPIVDYPG